MIINDLSKSEFTLAFSIIVPLKAVEFEKMQKILEGARNPAVLDKHFLHPDNLQNLIQWLGKHCESLKTYDRKAVERLHDIFKGYSRQRIFGGFWSETKLKMEEEESDVYQMIFQPDYASTTRWLNMNSDEINREASTLFTFILTQQLIPETDDAIVQLLRKHLTEWYEDVRLFVYGYLVFSVMDICAEEEIWITHQWGQNLTRQIRWRIPPYVDEVADGHPDDTPGDEEVSDLVTDCLENCDSDQFFPISD